MLLTKSCTHTKQKKKKNLNFLTWFGDPYGSWSALTFNNPLIK